MTDPAPEVARVEPLTEGEEEGLREVVERTIRDHKPRNSVINAEYVASLFATLDTERARLASAVARVEELEKSQGEWHRIATTLEFELDEARESLNLSVTEERRLRGRHQDEFSARVEAERSLLAVRDALRTVLGDYGNFTCPECGRGEIHKTGCSIFAALTATGPQAAEVERRLREEGAAMALRDACPGCPERDACKECDAEAARIVAARTHEKENRNG